MFTTWSLVMKKRKIEQEKKRGKARKRKTAFKVRLKTVASLTNLWLTKQEKKTRKKWWRRTMKKKDLKIKNWKVKENNWEMKMRENRDQRRRKANDGGRERKDSEKKKQNKEEKTQEWKIQRRERKRFWQKVLSFRNKQFTIFVESKVLK